MQKKVLIINCSDPGDWVSYFSSTLDYGVKRFVALSSPTVENLVQKMQNFTSPIPLATIILGTILEDNNISYDTAHQKEPPHAHKK